MRELARSAGQRARCAFRSSVFALPLFVLVFAGATLPGPAERPAAPAAGGTELQDPECIAVDRMPLEGRASPLDSASVQLAGETVKVCYGAPSARGRTMIGGDDVPYGELWRTGANEPTMIHLTAAAEVAGIRLEPGSYSLYTIPGAEEWQLFVSRSIEHWGLAIDENVRAQEVGEAVLPRERPEQHVETLRFRFEDEGSRAATMVLEWEDYRIRIPVELAG